MTHYEALGVPRNASTDDIKRAFRSKASANHPDRGGDGATMAGVNAAYEVLSDPGLRRQYDETIKVERATRRYVGPGSV